MVTNFTFLLSFHKDGFSIKSLMKIDMPLNKETKPNQNGVVHEIPWE